MSMSQEEIEALMSGADDIQMDDEDSTNDEEIVEETSTEAESEQSPEETTNKSEDEETPNVDELLAGIDGIIEDEEKPEEEESEVNIDDILANIEGITDDDTSSSSATESKDTVKETSSHDESLESKINNSQYPMPVSDENKVVNQLNQVADDSEEKASQIFDVLSFILDENNDIANYNKQMAEFIEKQKELLESLSTKFPNVNVFNENLEEAKSLTEVSQNLNSKIDGENNKVFEAMELMQYHDINRQKIERVMAVIKKLSSYLNGLFEDESDRAEVQIAKHISGDSNEIVDGDDIENLISEFSSLED